MPFSRFSAGVGRRVLFCCGRARRRYHFTHSAAGFQHNRGSSAECSSRISGGEKSTYSVIEVVGTIAGLSGSASRLQRFGTRSASIDGICGLLD